MQGCRRCAEGGEGGCAGEGAGEEAEARGDVWWEVWTGVVAYLWYVVPH